MQCNTNGDCTCKNGFTGSKCDECKPNYFDYPSCQGLSKQLDFKNINLIPSYVSECNCNPDGSTTLQCDGNGDCTCKDGYSGSKCVKCEAPLSYIGDKECDDVTNNAECNFDGGDCCMDVVSTEYCTECICKQ